MTIVAFVPLKLNNERLPGKNTLPFHFGEPLYHAIVKELLSVRTINSVFVYCSTRSIEADLPQGARYLERDPALDSSETLINSIISSFASKISADTYVLAHATAPFLTGGSVERLVESVISGAHDSAVTVAPVKEFLWRDGSPLNYNPRSIPRTQDLDPIFAETSGAWAFTNELARSGRRIGDRPNLVEVSRREAIDINDPIDFEIADALRKATPPTGRV